MEHILIKSRDPLLLQIIHVYMKIIINGSLTQVHNMFGWHKFVTSQLVLTFVFWVFFLNF